jgi:putative Holliday junction resolvase
MPILDLDRLPDAVAPGRRLLGLDVGDKTVGLAISDGAWSLASPIGTIRRRKFTEDAARLFETIDGREVGGLVVGLPINMDGSEGKRCQKTRQFAKNVLGLRDLPVAFWDERLSTAAVERAMLEDDRTRRQRAKSIDTAAAAWILQGALDRLDALAEGDDADDDGPDGERP